MLATFRAIVSLCLSLFSGVGNMGPLLPSDDKVQLMFCLFQMISVLRTCGSDIGVTLSLYRTFSFKYFAAIQH